MTGVCSAVNQVNITTLWSYNCASCHGQCVDCHRGWHGETCRELCKNCSIDGCKKNTGICIDCKYDAWGKSCSLPCPDNCIPGNTTFICRRKTGKCIDGCKDGFWGVKCTQPCSSGCLNKRCQYDCSRYTDGCKPGHYGDMCNMTCNDWYLNKTCRCDCSRCTDVCIAGFHGDLCNKTCSKGCLNETCHPDGTCLEGCKHAFTGKYCHHCAVSFYGKNCTMRCGVGCANHSCNEDGTCVCIPQYTGDKCTTFGGLGLLRFVLGVLNSPTVIMIATVMCVFLCSCYFTYRRWNQLCLWFRKCRQDDVKKPNSDETEEEKQPFDPPEVVVPSQSH